MSTHTDLDMTPAVHGNQPNTWFEAFKQHGFYLKHAIIATLIMGMFLLLLGAANLLFWHSFVVWGLVPMGIVATAFHGLFLVAQLVCLVRSSTQEG
jgi:hypothetical protein